MAEAEGEMVDIKLSQDDANALLAAIADLQPLAGTTNDYGYDQALATLSRVAGSIKEQVPFAH